MIYLITNIKQPLVKILAIVLSIITFWGTFAATLTFLSRLSFTNEATATVVDKYVSDDGWYITVTYTYDGINYRENYQSSDYQIGDKFSIFLKYNNPRHFYDASSNVSMASIFCYVVATIWFGICAILDISYFVFHKKLIVN